MLFRHAEFCLGSLLFEKCTGNLEGLYLERWLKREFPQGWRCVWRTSPQSLTEMQEERWHPREKTFRTTDANPCKPSPRSVIPGGPGRAAALGHPSECWMGCQVSLLISLIFGRAAMEVNTLPDHQIVTYVKRFLSTCLPLSKSYHWEHYTALTAAAGPDSHP